VGNRRLAGDLASQIRERIRDIPDFPQPGIVFKDITPVLGDATLLHAVVEHFAEEYAGQGIDRIAGIESRGFILGAPLAVALGVGFAPIRKPGKLPFHTLRVDYALEYGTDSLEAHIDAIASGERVLVVDDLLATGGTAAGAIQLIRELGGAVMGTAFLVELSALAGRRKLSDTPVFSLISYGD
jgi:adenine phosphoribosyltransferase